MSIKSPLHARNRHIDGYDYKLLSAVHPELCAFIINNQYNHQPTINFSDPDAVKALNCALLKHHYHIEHWDIPQGFLCPPIPGRVDYIHYLADLLKQSLAFVPSNHLDKVNVLDIGTGASCIYPILGKKEYNWSFVASDIDPISIQMAKNIIHLNHELKSSIECRLQIDSNKIFINVIKKK